MANLTKEQQEQIEAYVKAGTDRQTATRVVTAKSRKTAALKGNLNGERGFSLLK